MQRRLLSLRASHLIPLILCLQIQSISARPIVRGIPPNTREPQNLLLPTPLYRGVSGIEYTTSASPTPPTDDSWPTTVPIQEIADGQIQAPYFVFTEQQASPSSSNIATTASRSKMHSSNSTPTTPAFVVARQSTPPITSSELPVPSASQIAGISGIPAVAKVAPPLYQTTIDDNLLKFLTTSQMQTVTMPPPNNTRGAVHTSLERSGNPSVQPFPLTSLRANGNLSLILTSALRKMGPTATAVDIGQVVSNIFQPIATAAPPNQITHRSDHPVPRLGIQPQRKKLETNKFYANFFLGDQTAPAWTHPYSLSWSKGSGETGSWGMAISHIERTQLAIGAKTSADAGDWSFFANPVGIQSLVLSAVELGGGTTLTTDTLEAFSVNVNLLAAGASTPTITFPLVQGMGFITGVYNNGTPLLQSGIGIKSMIYVGSVGDGTTYKYRALLSNGFTWLIYVSPQSSRYRQNSFTLVSPMAVQGPAAFRGYIQIAKVPSGTRDAEAVYDKSAGAYATGVKLSGAVSGATGTYSLAWNKKGASSQTLLMFALPHHVESFGSRTAAAITDVKLITTTKGTATAVLANKWTLVEPDLPVDMAFAPWSPSGNVRTLSAAVKKIINRVGAAELTQNIMQQANVGSMYFDGKALAKFAAIVYTLHEMTNSKTVALTGLMKLEQAFAVHVKNQQTFPLVYDTNWGGAVSISTYLDGNSGDDFGNTYYNDHHFHYGYFVYAAAVIGYLDPAWLNQGTNKAWVNMLARDFANPVSDSYYPFSRSFDWYMGHSWAKGLFESADGKDEESSSEDTMASYGIKMWGKVTGDASMEARGNLMLAMQARSLSHYFLYQNNNHVEPKPFIGNKVSGILFENKIDHTTYFGHEIEYIQGIHMLPLMPMSTLIRSQTFVSQEWEAYNFGTYAQQVQSGWRGILMANLAIIDPVTSYNFFSNTTGEFTPGMLDGGASQTWYLAWSAALGGSS